MRSAGDSWRIQELRIHRIRKRLKSSRSTLLLVGRPSGNSTKAAALRFPTHGMLGRQDICATLGSRRWRPAVPALPFPEACRMQPGAVSRDVMLEHIAEIVAAVELPVNADFQAGYADEPEALAANVRLCVETGVAGLSIEDATGRPEEPLYQLTLAVERIKAARARPSMRRARRYC